MPIDVAGAITPGPAIRTPIRRDGGTPALAAAWLEWDGAPVPTHATVTIGMPDRGKR